MCPNRPRLLKSAGSPADLNGACGPGTPAKRGLQTPLPFASGAHLPDGAQDALSCASAVVAELVDAQR